MQLKSHTLVLLGVGEGIFTSVMSPLSLACRSIGSSTQGTASWARRGRRSLRVGITYSQNRTNKLVVLSLMLELTQCAQLGSLFSVQLSTMMCATGVTYLV